MTTTFEPGRQPRIAGWRKSSFSNGGDNCVEVGANADAVGVRDSKDRSRPPLVFSCDQWAAFLAGAKTGEFDLG